jgi:hypothetical protein
MSCRARHPRNSSQTPEDAQVGSEGFHENEARLSPRTKDLHRAIVSLMEELEAIDWYQQRMDATEDAELPGDPAPQP